MTDKQTIKELEIEKIASQTEEQCDKIAALSRLMGVQCRLLNLDGEGETYALGLGNKRYFVYTQKQVDQALREKLNLILEEEIDTIPEHLQRYFDSESWILNQIQHGGPMEFLSSDNTELSIVYKDVYYYVYWTH